MSNLMENQTENRVPETKTEGMSMIEKIMGIFVLLVLCLLPVVYHFYYFDILETKYQFYCIVAIGMMAVMFVYGMYTNKAIDYMKEIKVGSLIKSFHLVDWFVLTFWFANIMSWFFCEFRWEAFWGTSGRFNGAFLITIYTIVYFIVTRCFVLKRWYLDAFLLVSIFVCLFGITDFFQVDLLGFKELMLDEQRHLYTSTIGNINNYTAYVGMVLAVAVILFVLEKEAVKAVFYFVTMAIAMVAMIMGSSDNAYLSLATVFGFSPLYFFKNKVWIRRYLVSVATFLTVMLFVDWITHTFAGTILNIDSVFSLVISVQAFPFITGLLWGLLVVWSVVSKKTASSTSEEIGKWLRYAWGAVIIAVVSAAVFVLYDANIAGNPDKYKAIENYVVFNDSWGNSRGYVWIRSIEIFKYILTPFQKLFGYGADTFKLLIVRYFPTDESRVFDNAHNEYLHLLITTGLVGATSYILILGSAIKKMAKRMKHSPEVVATLFAVLAYAIQAVVNINLPVVFPITWMLLSMGLSRLPETNISSKRSVEDTNVLETGIVNKEEKTLQKDEQKQVIKKDKKPSVEQAAMAKIISVFVIGVLCVHPFLVDDAYFNILQTKYLGFCGMVLILLVLLASYGLYSGILIKGCKSFEIGKIVKGLSIADWGMIIFWFANVMSWVLVRDDSWRYEAFWGTSGRYCGVFLITLYMVVYFCITRLYEFKAWYLDAFLLVGMVICLFGITDYFKMDILNFKVRMIEKQKDKYTATIGNINTYTIYAAAVMAISMILYAVEKCNKKVIFYYVVMVISCAALIMGISDNAYLSLAAMFGLSPLYLFRSKIGTSRYFISIATFFTVILGINWINVTFEDAVIGIKSAFSIIAGMNGLPVVVGVLWVIAISITLGLLKDNSKQMGDEMPKWLSYIWWGVIALVVGAVVFAFYDATVVGNSSRYGAFAPYVTFSEEWGTERGWIWTRAVEMWSQKMSGLEKLFGCGADTFRLQIFKHYPDTYEYKGKVFDSAHNEYLHFLITVGLVGALSYVTWLFASVGKMWKHAKQSPAAAAIMFAILAYMVQATINIFVPVIFPVILVLLSIGLAIARNQEK